MVTRQLTRNNGWLPDVVTKNVYTNLLRWRMLRSGQYSIIVGSPDTAILESRPCIIIIDTPDTTILESRPYSIIIGTSDTGGEWSVPKISPHLTKVWKICFRWAHQYPLPMIVLLSLRFVCKNGFKKYFSFHNPSLHVFYKKKNQYCSHCKYCNLPQSNRHCVNIK